MIAYGIIPRHTRLSREGNLGQPQKENRVSSNDLVERENPFYEVILNLGDRREIVLKIKGL